MKLRFIGGNCYIHGIPARDLTDDEVEQYGYDMLIDSGMYEEYENIDFNEVKHGNEGIKKNTVRG